MTRQEFETVCLELRMSGYRDYIDPLDYEAATEIPCECGSANVTAQGFRHDTDRLSYRAFAICPDCGRITEF